MKKVTYIALALVVVLLVTTRTAFVVDQAEQAIIVQLGEPVGDVITQPGLHWRLPFIQDVRRFDKRLLDWDGDVSQIPTLGREFIIVDTTARWRITDPLQFLRSVRDEAGARTRSDDVLDSAARDVVSGTELEEIVRSADWQVDKFRGSAWRTRLRSKKPISSGRRRAAGSSRRTSSRQPRSRCRTSASRSWTCGSSGSTTSNRSRKSGRRPDDLRTSEHCGAVSLRG